MSTSTPSDPREAKRPRRVLMISAAFPPIAAPGVQRTAKLAKYLGRFGFEPIIWASDRIDGDVTLPPMSAVPDKAVSALIPSPNETPFPRLNATAVAATNSGRSRIRRIV